MLNPSYLTMSLARDMKASPEVLIIRSAEASLEFAPGLFLAKQDKMVDINCMRELAMGSKGNLNEVVPPSELDRTTLKLSGIRSCQKKEMENMLDRMNNSYNIKVHLIYMQHSTQFSRNICT